MNALLNNDGATLVCPKPGCGTVSPAGTRFCPACGTPLAAPESRLPPPPPPPRPDIFAQAGQFTGGGGVTKRFEVPLARQEAYGRLTAVLARGGFEPMEAAGPGTLKALHPYKHWTTLGLGLRYVCEFRLSDAGRDRSVVDVHIDLEPGILMRYLLTSVGATVVLGLLSGGIFLILGLIALPIDYQSVTKKIPGKIADRVAKEIGAEPKSFAAPPGAAPASWTPAPPAPAPAPAAAAVERAGSDTILAQIDRLAGLRDKGAITGPEFETKKAELLARL